MTPVELWALPGIPLVQPGHDLASLIVDAVARAGTALQPDDVLVVTGKIVSKAEGRLVDLRTVEPSARAVRLGAETEKDPRLVELVLRESVSIIRARVGNLLVRHTRGWVSAMAGVDRSNVAPIEEGSGADGSGEDDTALLLPDDPDASATALRDALLARTGVDVGVVISDSHGRPFRHGNVGVALGAAGVTALRQLEGRPDLLGRPLTKASVVPVADLLASAAMLISGEADEGTPVVLVRGAAAQDDPAPAATMIREPSTDLFAIPDREY
jgi:coenzyme F420-0:L-glutamate ligase/coenzyme F420-1:gamma-L-glutamate ligase